MKNFLKNPFKYLFLVTQLLSATEALYETVTSLDDDPEVQALWEKVKNDAVVATRVVTLRLQWDAIVNIVKQLKK